MSDYDFSPWLIGLCALTTVWFCRRAIASYLLDRFDALVSGEVSRDRKEREGREAPGRTSPDLSFREALKPCGGAPSWESVRRSER